MIPPLEPYCGSWICTSPTGMVIEFYRRKNAERAFSAGWLVETAAGYLARINQEIKKKPARESSIEDFKRVCVKCAGRLGAQNPGNTCSTCK